MSTASPSPLPNDLPPELARHPRYRILKELGRGGMGVVYQAEQTMMDRPVAIKVIGREVLSHPDALERFRREIKTAAKLAHPNIVIAHDAEQVGDLCMLVMEYVEGHSLDEVLRRHGPLPVPQACHYIRQAALGLQQAAKLGMVHRDIKPHNLMLTPEGQVKILDFGLAKVVSENGTRQSLTASGAYMGTPEYCAPEQAADARQADIRADIYALGCTLYALLAGGPPFQEDTAVLTILAHMQKPPPPLAEVRPDAPPKLGAVVARMLAKDPARRQQTPAEVAQALAPFCKQDGRGAGECSEVEALLARRYREALERTRGKPTTADRDALVQLCRQYGIPGERANAIVREVRARWQDRPNPLDCTGSEGVTAADVRRAQEAWAKYLGREVEETVEIASGVKMTFVLVPPGKFLMGSRTEEEERVDDETLHEVTLTQPFYLGKTQATQSQYQALTGNNPSHVEGADLPAEMVRWEEARDFAVQLTKKREDRCLYRLPTEAEWEYSCRGGRPSSQTFGVGDGRALSSREANFDGNYPYGGADKGPALNSTCAVGSYPANALGLYDMHGNVWERCADWYGPYPNGDVTNPTGPSEGSRRVVRGGGWRSSAGYCRAAYRYSYVPGRRFSYVGLRLARDLPSDGK